MLFRSVVGELHEAEDEEKLGLESCEVVVYKLESDCVVVNRLESREEVTLDLRGSWTRYVFDFDQVLFLLVAGDGCVVVVPESKAQFRS